MFFKKKRLDILLLLSIAFNLANADEDSPSVIIVGAGPSGIAAASKLFQNGFKNVKILEAQDRIGGRVFTTKFSNYSVDMGGQWVHGEKDNVAFELAWPLGVLEKGGIISSLNHYRIIDSSGNLIDQALTDDVVSHYFKLKEDLTEYSKNTNGSIGEYFVSEMNKYFKEHPDWAKNSEGILHLLNMMEMSTESGDTWWDVSTTGLTQFHDSEGDFMINWKDRGYGTILDILMKRYPNPEEELPVMNNTILNAEVTLIDYSDENGKVIVKTANGDSYSADHVIVTCSLGVLKEEYNSLFKPPLPEEKQRTIKGLGFGSVAKIYYSFENPVYNNDTEAGFNVLWKKEELEELEKDPERRWLLGIIGFFFVEHKPRLLYAWISGNYSRDMEKLSDQLVFNQTVEVLQRFVGKYRQVPTPTGMLRSTWNSNKHFRGTYSYRSMESDADNAWHATLAEPIDDKKPVVLFAGEGTSPHHFSTVHGAIETGWREADRLIKHRQNLGKS